MMSAASAKVAAHPIFRCPAVLRSSEVKPRSQPATVVVLPRRCSEKARMASEAAMTPNTSPCSFCHSSSSGVSSSSTSSLHSCMSPFSSSSAASAAPAVMRMQFCRESCIVSNAFCSESLNLQNDTPVRSFIACSTVRSEAVTTDSEGSPDSPERARAAMVSIIPRAMSSAERIRKEGSVPVAWTSKWWQAKPTPSSARLVISAAASATVELAERVRAGTMKPGSRA
mmetsp:Transcript_53190/g.99757  ORF Transcript_53190/g.99757 Transcript_53190/m.99757 type:complete len:227 (+) Transcript_53190:202-882(+)